MKRLEVTDAELETFFLKIKNRYGYDFSEYYRSSLQRRLTFFLDTTPFQSLHDFLIKLLNDESFFTYFLSHILVSVTEMFRDPTFFQEFIEKIVPVLRTYPFFKIWHAGCASGEEVYSMAILLKELGLLKRSLLYATDINLISLKTAREGIYPQAQLEEAASRYRVAGGTGSLSHYYIQKYGFAKLHDYLKENIVFSTHNLVGDGIFGEINVIICRNVLIYFNRDLQNKVLNLFYGSLVNRGFLCLGPKESLEFLDVKTKLEFLSDERIYRKKE